MMSESQELQHIRYFFPRDVGLDQEKSWMAVHDATQSVTEDLMNQ